jgi:hypothetical protein
MKRLPEHQSPSHLGGNLQEQQALGLFVKLIVMESSKLMQDGKTRTPRVLKSFNLRSH